MTVHLPSAIEDGQWLVQLARDDVRVLSHGQLRAALRSGGVSAAAFVWKNGMSQWLAAGTLPELGAVSPSRAAPAAVQWGPAPVVSRAPSVRIEEQRVQGHGAPNDSLLAFAVAALLAILLVSWGLSLGGVFDDHAGKPASTHREP